MGFVLILRRHNPRLKNINQFHIQWFPLFVVWNITAPCRHLLLNESPATAWLEATAASAE
jgi:hypothetical protein